MLLRKHPSRIKFSFISHIFLRYLIYSSIYYLGYVEEDETPEMIMKKFEALQKMENTLLAQKNEKEVPPVHTSDISEVSSPVPETELSESHLATLFKETSMLNMVTESTSHALASTLGNNTLIDNEYYISEDEET